MNNPMTILNADPEQATYLLLATYIVEDNEMTEGTEWIEFSGRKSVYDFIKENLTLDDDNSYMIDLDKSYVLINGEPYNSENKRTAFTFMNIVKDVYNDDFNPSDYVIRNNDEEEEY